MGKKIRISSLILILLLNGCTIDVTNKDQFTRPVRIHLQLGGDLDPCYWVDPQKGKYLIAFERCHIGINKMVFDAVRDASGEIGFETDVGLDLPKFGFTGHYVPVSEFDIPQGIYNEFKWDIHLKKVTSEELIIEGDTVSRNPGLFITGCYNHIWYKQDLSVDSTLQIPFIFAVPETELFNFISFSDIVFDQNKDCVLNLIFHFSEAFGLVLYNAKLFEEAEITGNDYLTQRAIISKDKNKILYNDLLEWLKLSLGIHIY